MALSSLVGLGCEGGLAGPAGPGVGGSPLDPDDPQNPNDPDEPHDPGEPGPGGVCGPRLPARLLLLSDYQAATALKTLLGDGALPAGEAPEAQTKPFTQKGVVVNTSLLHGRLSWAEQASQSLDTNFMTVTGCPETGDDACARRFIEGFAARAFRRPVEADEVDDMMDVYAVGKQTSFVQGVKRMIEAVLGAPSFLYRRELGEPDGADALTLSPYELASTLSFMLTDAPPDDALWEAAENGQLGEPGEIAAQVTRLLGTPKVRDALTSTLMAAWGVGNLFGTVKDPSLYPEYTPLLQASMYRETELFVHDTLWEREAPVHELLTSRNGFVNEPLAEVYGVDYAGTSDEFVPVTLPEQRSGLLTQASVLSTLARTDTTSVVARGLFVRALMCLSKVPAPPEALSTQIQNLLMADMTERERAEVRKMNNQCSGCHAGIDPFGLLLESYDPIGRYRTTLRGEPIDASAEVANQGNLTGSYMDAVDFLTSAAEQPDFAACLGTRLLAYGTQDDSLLADDCQVTQAMEGLDLDSLSMPDLVQAVATSPALRQRLKEEP